jgi:hypothetical protein
MSGRMARYGATWYILYMCTSYSLLPADRYISYCTQNVRTVHYVAAAMEEQLEERNMGVIIVSQPPPPLSHDCSINSEADNVWLN